MMQQLTQSSPLAVLSHELRADWPAIAKARRLSETTRARLEKRLADCNPSDTSIVVFGSLARQEFTSNSDLDWTLLIDGQADAIHYDTVGRIAAVLKKGGFREPGREGVFGNVAFSHPILHQIGGEEDTNRNTTQRTLLLLESLPIGKRDAYDRVLKVVLERYVVDDHGLRHPNQRRFRVPRFLLNDIVRYWRTVAVDFVYKQRNRTSGWALRNAKLRMSRKLIFAAGLLVCFGVDYEAPLEVRDCMAGAQPNPAPLVRFLREKLSVTPLEILAGAILQRRTSRSTARGLFDAYNEFLRLLSIKVTRERLGKTTFEDAAGDPVFRRLREIGQVFHRNLIQLFYTDKKLRSLTEWYGVF